VGRGIRGPLGTDARAAAGGAQIVFSCVGNDNDLRQVTLGADGAFAGMQRGAVYADHSTVSAKRGAGACSNGTRGGFRLSRCAGFRRPGGAEKGVLTIMVGATQRPLRLRDP